MWTNLVAEVMMVVVRQREISVPAGRMAKQPAGKKEDWKKER
jgi:hypothetical protein